MCITESVKDECCFLGICIECWIAFDQSEHNLVVSMDFGSWLGFFLMNILALYNLYWFWQEKRLYYKIKGSDHIPLFGFFGEEDFNEEAEEEVNRRNSIDIVRYGSTNGIVVPSQSQISKSKINRKTDASQEKHNVKTIAEMAPLTDDDNQNGQQQQGIVAAGSDDDDENVAGDYDSVRKDNMKNRNKNVGADIVIPGEQQYHYNGMMRGQKPKYNIAYPWFRLNIAFYCSITGCFALIRNEWQLGKPLLVGAAGHNLSEWAMVSFAYFKTSKGQYYSFVFEMLWIWFVICCVVMIPSFPAFALAEQMTGIVLDWLLPFTWWFLARQNWDSHRLRNMFLMAWFAHFVHLYFTIIPLVIENFIVGQSFRLSAVLEFSIFMSAVITMVLYTAFVPRYQTLVLSKSPLPDNFVAPKLWLYVIISFVLGLLTTTIIPAIIGECDEDGH